MEMNGVEQARRMMALRSAQSSGTGGWYPAEPDLASSSAGQGPGPLSMVSSERVLPANPVPPPLPTHAMGSVTCR